MERTFLSPTKDFVGCISNVTVNRQKLDLSVPLYNFKSQAKCPAPKTSCSDDVCTKLINGECLKTLKGRMCECRGRFSGQKCEKGLSIFFYFFVLVVLLDQPNHGERVTRATRSYHQSSYLFRREPQSQASGQNHHSYRVLFRRFCPLGGLKYNFNSLISFFNHKNSAFCNQIFYLT